MPYLNKSTVYAILLNQVFMRSLLNDMPIIKNNNLIGSLYG